jgi:hypothetical protein
MSWGFNRDTMGGLMVILWCLMGFYYYLMGFFVIFTLHSDFMGGWMVILWDSMGFYEIWMGYQGDINGIWWSFNEVEWWLPHGSSFQPRHPGGAVMPAMKDITGLCWQLAWLAFRGDSQKKHVQKLDSWPHRKNGSENDRESIAGSKNWGLLMFVQEFCLWVLYKNNFRLETWW